MCLGVPGRIVEKYERQGIMMGKVDFGGVTKEVCLAYMPEIQLGEYAIVHVGFAITQVDEQSAHETLDLFRQMGAWEEAVGMTEDEMIAGFGDKMMQLRDSG